MNALYVSQAECRIIARDPTAMLTTVLGSCIACCMWDPAAQVGGMNHFLLPENGSGNLAALSAGITSMEVLINECVKAGASREGLRARLFGGASVVPHLSDVGARNVSFATRFLMTERIVLVSSSVGARGRGVSGSGRQRASPNSGWWTKSRAKPPCGPSPPARSSCFDTVAGPCPVGVTPRPCLSSSAGRPGLWSGGNIRR